MMVIALSFVLGSMSSTALADSMIDVSASVGMAHLIPEEGDSYSGVGLDVTIGLPVGIPGLVPEVMVGYTTNEMDIYSFNNLMIMGGLRFDFPISVLIEPFVYGHVGFSSLSVSLGSQSSDSTSYLGMNVGAGVRYMLADTIGVGISGGPAFVFGDDDLGTLTYIRANVNALLRL